MDLLINSAHGVYIPQIFAENYGFLLDPEDKEILKQGPDHEEYWDTWADIIDKDYVINGKGVTIEEIEGDIWAKPTELQYTMKIKPDMDAQNPWEDWDCEPPLIWNSGPRGKNPDYGVTDFIKSKARDVLSDEEYEEMEYTIESMADFCEKFGIPYKHGQTVGYSQGDFAEYLIVLTPDWIEKVGCNPDRYQSNLDSAAELLGWYLWGDVWGFTVEDQYENEHDSCWGFYGDYKSEDIESQMVEHLSDEVKKSLTIIWE